MFKMAAVHHTGFSKVRNFSCLSHGEYLCVIVLHFVVIGQTVAEIKRFDGFQNAAVRHLGFVVRKHETTHEDQFVVFSFLQNLVEIGCAVLYIREFQCYASLA